MKKYTFAEQLNDVCWIVFNDLLETIQQRQGGETQYQTAVMIAYERWLNNKPLMSKEEKK